MQLPENPSKELQALLSDLAAALHCPADNVDVLKVVKELVSSEAEHDSLIEGFADLLGDANHDEESMRHRIEELVRAEERADLADLLVHALDLTDLQVALIRESNNPAETAKREIRGTLLGKLQSLQFTKTAKVGDVQTTFPLEPYLTT